MSDYTPDETTCGICDGERVTDDNEDRTERAPWSFWQRLTPPSNMAVTAGLVRPAPCFACVEGADDE